MKSRLQKAGILRKIWLLSLKINWEEYGISSIFAGTQMDDKTKLHVVMKFESMQALEKFRDDDELTERRRKVGAVIESGIQVPISSNFMTNFPNIFW